MKFNRKNVITFIIVVICSILFIVIGNKTNKTKILDDTSQNYYRAEVLQILDSSTESTELGEGSKQEIKNIQFKAKLITGPNRGKAVTMVQTIDSMYAIQTKEIQQGDKIIAYYEPGNEAKQESYSFAQYYRSTALIIILLIFLLLIIVIGRSKGVFTIISLGFTILAVFCVFIPAIINGRNIYATTVVVSVFTILMTLLLINGADKKTLCAVLGNIGGLAVAGIMAIVMSKVLNITGAVDEEYVFIMVAQLDKPLDLVGLVWSGIVIGSLGAVMDVAMSISSAMNELSENMEDKSFVKMLKSGMNIGRDAIGTMANTLILAYVGSSLATVLLLTMYSRNLMYLFNLEMIVVEIMQAIIGSTGILCAVPATALFAAYIFTKKDNKPYVYVKKDDIGGIKL